MRWTFQLYDTAIQNHQCREYCIGLCNVGGLLYKNARSVLQRKGYTGYPPALYGQALPEDFIFNRRLVRLVKDKKLPPI